MTHTPSLGSARFPEALAEGIATAGLNPIASAEASANKGLDLSRSTVSRPESGAGLWRLFSFALGLSFLLLAGCGPEEFPCKGVSCGPDAHCEVEDGEAVCKPNPDPCDEKDVCDEHQVCLNRADGSAYCAPRSKCEDVKCNVGSRCAPATGKCVEEDFHCSVTGCAIGSTCNEETGACDDNNAGCTQCCADGEVCNPILGQCVADLCRTTPSKGDRTKPLLCDCGPTQVCNPVDGACLDLPSRCGACESNQYCDDKSGHCIDIRPVQPVKGEVGAACKKPSDCSRSGAYAFCIEDDGLFGEMPDGMCSASCDQVGCPAGAACVDVGLEICLDVCLDDSECREGYGCQSLSSDDPKRYCFPEGGGGSECSGAECAPVGEGCSEDDDCEAGAICQRSLPGGYCVKSNCDPQTECRGGADGCECLTNDSCSGSTIGLAMCNFFEQDCRPGYACIQVYAEGPTGVCWARHCDDDQDCRVAGDSCSQEVCDPARGVCHDACTVNADCVDGLVCDVDSGRCVKWCENSTDWCGPDARCDVDSGICVKKCHSDTNCASDHFCHPGGISPAERALEGQCVPKCADDGQCKQSEYCSRLGRCKPRCNSDDQCSSLEYCEEGRCLSKCTAFSGCSMGQFCDVSGEHGGEPGRCRLDLSHTKVGSACQVDAECGAYNATCVKQGFAGGYCSSLLCSDKAPCPSGAACVEHEGQQLCSKKCNPEKDQCRSGYECVETAGEHVCLPEAP